MQASREPNNSFGSIVWSTSQVKRVKFLISLTAFAIRFKRLSFGMGSGVDTGILASNAVGNKVFFGDDTISKEVNRDAAEGESISFFQRDSSKMSQRMCRNCI